MLRKYLLPLLAIAGFLTALFTVVRGSVPVQDAKPVAFPSRPPYESYVGGSGIIEASSENIAIGTPVGGVVTEIFVKVGSAVKAGAPLFKIDDRNLQAELEIRKANVQSAQAKLQKLQSFPRPEDLPPAEARVLEVRSSLDDLKDQLARWESVEDKRAVMVDDLNRKRFAVKTAQARLQQAESELALLKAGSWKADIEIAKAEVATAESQQRAVETEMERHLIRAPVNGELLQVKIRLGEFALAGVLQTPLMLIGDMSKMHVRVDVDENDAWRVRPNAKATAFVRGNRSLNTALEFVRIEPYVVPKKSLTGDSTERVDTRVLQVLFSFDRSAIPVYVGQQMDVFIDAGEEKRP